MVNFLSDNIHKIWLCFLQELELAKHYYMPYMLDLFSTPHRNPLLDYLLPSLLYIKMVTILDEALVFFIDHHGLTPPKKYKKSLYGRIEFLNDQGFITDCLALHSIKDIRNELAHEVSVTTTWANLECHLNTVEKELQHLGFVGDRPRYEYFGECSAMRAGDEPGVDQAQDYKFGIKHNGVITEVLQSELKRV